MNKRIQQLKEQAMEWVPNQVDPDTKIRLLNAEKFAELIVQECVGVVDNAVTHRESASTYVNKIKEYFGVE